MLKDITSSAITQISKQVPNREKLTQLALVALFSGGHILLTCNTGNGKSTWTKALAQTLGLSHGRVRIHDNIYIDEVFGNFAWNEDTRINDVWLPGAMFNQVVQVDNINTANPSLYDSIADAMEFKCVNPYIRSEKTIQPPKPFFIIASVEETSHEIPKEASGETSGAIKDNTPPLPESIHDRFMFKLPLHHPGVVAEKQILQALNTCEESSIKPADTPLPVCNAQAIIQAKKEAQAVIVDDQVLNYIISTVETTRRVNAVKTGVSLRATKALTQGTKAYAAMQGRDYATIDDVRYLATPVLAHRLKLTQAAQQDGLTPEKVIESILTGKKPGM